MSECIEVGLFYKCISNCSSGNNYLVALGTNQFDGTDDGSLVLKATTTIVHEKFNSYTFDNDIALIQLPMNVKFTREYCHVMTNVKIVLLVLEQIKCFLFAAQNLFVYLIHVVKDFSVL
jgi:hypothetical protein